MSSENQVSYRSYLLRLRKLAKRALEDYGLTDVKLEFRSIDGNGIYRVIVPPRSTDTSLITPGQYNLRLHQPGYMNPAYISSEMEWLSALDKAGIPVPKPCRNLEGNWVAEVKSDYEFPCSRNCTLIGWVDGRLPKDPFPHHMKALGRLLGRMHEQSIGWNVPRGFSRPHWDWDGLYGDGFDYGFRPEDARNTIPKGYQSAFTQTIDRVQETMDQMGRNKDVYGIIHSDLGVDGNILFYKGEARPIDFDDCGFGYWLFDLGAALAHYFAEIEKPRAGMRDALIEGYKETTPLSELNLDYLDLFIAARLAQLIYFYHGMAIIHPQFREESNRKIAGYGQELKRVLKKSG